jgi:ABC-type transport system involved in cytochrome c biogenesis permease component
VTFLATLVLALLLGLVGTGFVGWLAGSSDGNAFRGVLAILAGVLVLHAVLTLWVALGVGWTRTSILVPLLVIGVVLKVWAPKPGW